MMKTYDDIFAVARLDEIVRPVNKPPEYVFKALIEIQCKDGYVKFVSLEEDEIVLNDNSEIFLTGKASNRKLLEQAYSLYEYYECLYALKVCRERIGRVFPKE